MASSQSFLPIAVIATSGDVGEVKGRRAELPYAANPARERGFRGDGFGLITCIGGHAGADKRLVELASSRYPEAAIIEVGALGLVCPIGIIVDRVVNKAGDNFRRRFAGVGKAVLDSDGNTEMGNAVEKIEGAVQGMHDPAVFSVAALGFSALLHQHTEIGTRVVQFFPEHVLGLGIRGGDEIPRALWRYLELLDLAEIPV